MQLIICQSQNLKVLLHVLDLLAHHLHLQMGCGGFESGRKRKLQARRDGCELVSETCLPPITAN